MNAAYFLTPKSSVAYLYDDCTLRQGLEKMRIAGYTAIPVISRSGKYVGSIREGDFLWYLVEEESGIRAHSLRDLETVSIREVLQSDLFPPARITVPMEEIVERSICQNFVPMVDDSDNFIGIITRMTILKHLTHPKQSAEPPQLIASLPMSLQR